MDDTIPVWDDSTEEPRTPPRPVRTTRPRVPPPAPPRRRRGLVGGLAIAVAAFLAGVAAGGILIDGPDDGPAPTVTLTEDVSIVTVSGDEGALAPAGDDASADDGATSG